MRRVVLHRKCLLLLPLIFLMAGCDLPHSTRPSVLVVAVDGLGVDRLSCDPEEVSEPTYDAIRPFCEEAVRFSHAYAPSTLSQATLTSILTGLYPFDHGVRDNGANFLSAHFQTAAEAALDKGYRTFFVSGGPPVFRKSGLSQGFEVFDDASDVGPGMYYRRAEEVFHLTMTWLDRVRGRAPFFAFLSLSDLSFPQVATTTNEGEVRERSTEAQVEEVSEKLGELVRWLKKKGLWNSANIVLVGLNSRHESESAAAPAALSLKSSSVQVALFIKPARKEAEHVIQWAVDRNVSLVDLGKTLFEWTGSTSAPCSVPELEPESLVPAVTQAEPAWRENRVIVSESAWPEWVSQAGIRYAFRLNQLLYIHDSHPLIFNTLTDRMETLPLKLNDPLWTSLNSPIEEILSKNIFPAWGGLAQTQLDRLAAARELWGSAPTARVTNGRESWSRWYLRKALVARDWREVKRLAQERGDLTGLFVATRHLNEPGAAAPREACARMLLGLHSEKRQESAECGDEMALALKGWQAARGEDEKVSAQERFERLYMMYLMDQDIGRLNYLNELRWDVNRDWPLAPQAVDYILTMKDWEPFAKKLSAFLNGKNLAF